MTIFMFQGHLEVKNNMAAIIRHKNDYFKFRYNITAILCNSSFWTNLNIIISLE